MEKAKKVHAATALLYRKRRLVIFHCKQSKAETNNSDDGEPTKNKYINK